MRPPILRFSTWLTDLLAVLTVLTAASFGAACRSPQPPQSPAVSPDTWATVDGRPITDDYVEKAFRRVRDASQTLSDEELLTAKLALLNDLIVEDIQLAKARELKINVTESELDMAFAEAKKGMTDPAFEKELSQRNLTVADMREGLRRQLLSQKVFDQEVKSKVSVADQEISEFFNANRTQFNLAEEAYRVAQIVVTPVREPRLANRTGDDAATPQAAQTKIGMLMQRLQTGADFSDLAMDYSEDPESAPRGGDLGMVPVSTLKASPPALRDAVLNGKPGSARVVSQGGAHTIILVVAREAAGQRDLSTPGVRDRITEMLRARKEQLLRTAYVTVAQTDADVVNYRARRVVESRGKP